MKRIYLNIPSIILIAILLSGIIYSCTWTAEGSADLSALKGDTGEKGDQGDKGDTGEKGDKGDTGETGPAGSNGTCSISTNICISTTIRITNDTLRQTGATGYTKVKEIKSDGNFPSSNLTIIFDLATSHIATTAHAKIYLNGSPLSGDYQTNSLTFVTQSYTFTGSLNSGDLIQIYAYNVIGGTYVAYVANMRFKYSMFLSGVGGLYFNNPATVQTMELSNIPSYNFTNQDP